MFKTVENIRSNGFLHIRYFWHPKVALFDTLSWKHFQLGYRKSCYDRNFQLFTVFNASTKLLRNKIISRLFRTELRVNNH